MGVKALKPNVENNCSALFVLNQYMQNICNVLVHLD